MILCLGYETVIHHNLIITKQITVECNIVLHTISMSSLLFTIFQLITMVPHYHKR